MNTGYDEAALSFQAIHAALAADAKTREPMNALTVWTEIGRGLSGTLEKKGASPGLIQEIIATYCRSKGAREDVDLARWAYRVPPDERLATRDIAAAMRRVIQELEARLPELAAEAETATEKERDLFMAIVRGWFPVGLDILRAFPGASGPAADDAERLGALALWCDRYLPKDSSGPKELGVRVAKD